MRLDLPAELTDPKRRAWIEQLAAEWRRPHHGSLGGPVLLLRAVRGRLATWAAGHPWSTYSAEACFDLIEDYLDRHAYAVRLFLDATPDQFAQSDSRKWAALTWDLVLACAPLSFARQGLRLDVLWTASWNELTRRMEREQPGAWGLIVAMSAFDLPPSSPAGRLLHTQIFPGWGPDLETLAANGRDRFRKMVLKKLSRPLKKRIKAEHGADVLQTACWQSLQSFYADKSARELVLAVLRGKLRLVAKRAANRVQNYDRSQYGERVVMPDQLDESGQPVRRHPTELTVSFEAPGVAKLDWGNDHWQLDLDRHLFRIDMDRLVAQKPTVRKGWEILVARELDNVAWATLEAQYKAHRTTLTRWMAEARVFVRQRLTQ